MTEFYEKFKADLERAEREMEDIKRREIPTDIDCDKCGRKMALRWGKHGSFLGCTGYPECTNTRQPPAELVGGETGEYSEQEEELYCDNCGRPMVLKKGRFGQFYACSGYPDCKTTRPIAPAEQQKKADVPLEEECPQCGAKLAIKYGRFGEFTACSNYPKCKFVKQKTTGVTCPSCGKGEIIERRSKKGRTFFGCNRYPDCDFVAWGKPLEEECPECKSPYLIEKRLKSGHFAQCPNKDCKYKRELAAEPVGA
jgi:DNA topoisomerase-1